MLILAVLLNVWGQLHTLFRRYIRPGISCYRRRGRFNEFIESDTDKAWIKFTSAISISLRPKAAREISDLILRCYPNEKTVMPTSDLVRHCVSDEMMNAGGKDGLDYVSNIELFT